MLESRDGLPLNRLAGPPRRAASRWRGPLVAGVVACHVLLGATVVVTAGAAELAAADLRLAPTGAQAADASHGGDAGHHEESLFAFVSRLLNFAVLAGGLYVLVRSPLARYLAARGQQIRADLAQAAETRRAAEAELQLIAARMQALPDELAALEARGRAEIDAERQRIRQAAAAERERLLQQARREIDQQLQTARRMLREEGADLAVGIARARLAQELTDADRLRLVDRYVARMQAVHD